MLYFIQLQNRVGIHAFQCRADGELPHGRKEIFSYGVFSASHCSIKCNFLPYTAADTSFGSEDA